jgi:hypothetical protein
LVKTVRKRSGIAACRCRQIRTVTEFALGRPELVGILRTHPNLGVRRFGPTAHAMIQLLTGLDQIVQTTPIIAWAKASVTKLRLA